MGKGFGVSESPTAPLGLGFGCGTALSNDRFVYPRPVEQSLVSMKCMVMLSMRVRSESPYNFSIGVNGVLTNSCHRSCSSLSHPVTVSSSPSSQQAAPHCSQHHRHQHYHHHPRHNTDIVIMVLRLVLDVTDGFERLCPRGQSFYVATTLRNLRLLLLFRNSGLRIPVA